MTAAPGVSEAHDVDRIHNVSTERRVVVRQ